MEDYIFLLLAVGLSIYTAISKKKKKPEEIASEQEEEESSRNFLMDQILGDDFLSDFESKPKEYKQPEVVRREPMVAKSMKSQLTGYESKFTSSLPERKSASTIREEKSIADKENFENEQESEESIISDFSLKKAFVYSEIMNPKYIEPEVQKYW